MEYEKIKDILIGKELVKVKDNTLSTFEIWWVDKVFEAYFIQTIPEEGGILLNEERIKQLCECGYTSLFSLIFHVQKKKENLANAILIDGHLYIPRVSKDKKGLQCNKCALKEKCPKYKDDGFILCASLHKGCFYIESDEDRETIEI